MTRAGHHHPALTGGPVYLDYNATTPVDPRVVDAALPYWTVHFGNPSSDHAYATDPRGAVAEARARVASLLGAPPGSVVFTGSGSEADNHAITGPVAARGAPAHVLTQVTEHPAVLRTVEHLTRAGLASVTVLGVDGDGRVDPAALEAAITPATAVVSVMHANNETGVIQPIAELARIAHAHGALMHTDAAQTYGKIPTRVDDLEVDLLSIAGHKLYAPKGVGALYIRPGRRIAPLVHGGGQEGGRRAGTESVAHIVALGTAAALAGEHLSDESARLRDLRDRLHRRLDQRLPGRVHLNGHPRERLPTTVNLSIDSVDARALLAAVPGVAASTGSACHAGTSTPSPVLVAMGRTREQALGAIRLSVGRYTTGADVERAADLIAAAALADPAPS
jgi:cysteine desulfurase